MFQDSEFCRLYKIIQCIYFTGVSINISAVKCMSICLASSSAGFHNENWVPCVRLGNLICSKRVSVVSIAVCWENRHSAAHLLVWLVPTSDQPPFSSSDVLASSFHGAFVHAVFFAWYIHPRTQVCVWDMFSGSPSLNHECRSDERILKFWIVQARLYDGLINMFSPTILWALRWENFACFSWLCYPMCLVKYLEVHFL